MKKIICILLVVFCLLQISVVSLFAKPSNLSSGTALEITDDMPILAYPKENFTIAFLLMFSSVLLLICVCFLYFEQKQLSNFLKPKTVFIILLLFVILAFVFFSIDSFRASRNELPLFCVEYCSYLDGGTKEYLGLGYKVLAYQKNNGYKKIHIGSFFLKYDTSLDGGIYYPTTLNILVNNELILP